MRLKPSNIFNVSVGRQCCVKLGLYAMVVSHQRFMLEWGYPPAPKSKLCETKIPFIYRNELKDNFF